MLCKSECRNYCVWLKQSLIFKIFYQHCINNRKENVCCDKNVLLHHEVNVNNWWCGNNIDFWNDATEFHVLCVGWINTVNNYGVFTSNTETLWESHSVKCHIESEWLMQLKFHLWKSNIRTVDLLVCSVLLPASKDELLCEFFYIAQHTRWSSYSHKCQKYKFWEDELFSLTVLEARSMPETQRNEMKAAI